MSDLPRLRLVCEPTPHGAEIRAAIPDPRRTAEHKPADRTTTKEREG